MPLPDIAITFEILLENPAMVSTICGWFLGRHHSPQFGIRSPQFMPIYFDATGVSPVPWRRIPKPLRGAKC
jgi:hypothetical protein